MESNKHGKHLVRLSNVWLKNPIYFITSCTKDRKKILATEEVHRILLDEWIGAPERYGWFIGRYVIMPDHVHFFASPNSESVGLSRFVQGWKQWSSKRISKPLDIRPIWHKQFFDHILRNNESRSEKWDYVRMNPVRAGLVENANDWTFSGSVHFE